jgi:hypothetical protein
LDKIHSSETSVYIWAALRYIPEDYNIRYQDPFDFNISRSYPIFNCNHIPTVSEKFLFVFT